MNKLKSITVLIIMFGITAAFLASCTKSDKDVSKTDKQQTEQKQTMQESKMIAKSDSVAMKNAKYVCPMHPLERSNEPGKCPICRMNLVLVAELNKQMADEHEKLEQKFTGTENAIHFEVNTSVIKSEDCMPVIDDALGKDRGVIGYHIDILNNVIHMYLDKTKTTKPNVEKLIADAGFDANNTKANPEAFNKLPQSCK
jgi:heavy metal-binding protein